MPAGSFSYDGVAKVFEDDAVLAFAANQGKKLGWAKDGDATETWTALSTGAFGSKNKHPQEQLRGTDVEERVKNEMLAALGSALGASEPLAPLRWRLQLWGAALPLNAHVSDVPFAWDADNKIGIVGDWLSVEGGPVASIEAAFCSGDALAKHLAAAPSESAGLEGSYKAFETVFSRRPPRSAAPPAKSSRTDAEKQEKKLRKSSSASAAPEMDYMTLTTDQRVKIHGEHVVLEKLGGLASPTSRRCGGANCSRRSSTPSMRPKLRMSRRLETPMPSWSAERDDQREEDKKRRAWEERQNAKGQTRRKGDWDCEECGNMNFAKRTRCNKCSAPRPVAARSPPSAIVSPLNSLPVAAAAGSTPRHRRARYHPTNFLGAAAGFVVTAAVVAPPGDAWNAGTTFAGAGGGVLGRPAPFGRA